MTPTETRTETVAITGELRRLMRRQTRLYHIQRWQRFQKQKWTQDQFLSDLKALRLEALERIAEILEEGTR